MRYISASATHSDHSRDLCRNLSAIFLILSAMLCLLSPVFLHAEILERVVAYVDDAAITLSDFRDKAQLTRRTLPNATDSDIINSMINSLLLLREAKKMMIEGSNTDEIIRDYIDIRIKSSIIIKETDIEHFYAENKDKFKGQDYLAVRDEIEKYLFELETNKRLKQHIEELRARADIKIQL